MTLIFSAVGVLLGVFKDIARANYDDPDFNWKAYLGERPFQVVARIAVIFGVLTPGAVQLASSAMENVDFTGVPILAQIVVPLLVGLYGDKVGKNLLERIESVSPFVPLLGKLFKIGKRLT